jgi:hypothetical protein
MVGIFCGNLVYFPPWYFVPRKIWQPWRVVFRFFSLFFMLRHGSRIPRDRRRHFSGGMQFYVQENLTPPPLKLHHLTIYSPEWPDELWNDRPKCSQPSFFLQINTKLLPWKITIKMLCVGRYFCHCKNTAQSQ